MATADLSPALTTECAVPRREPFQADSLALGMFVLVGMSIIQRTVGFARSVGFCRFLDEAALGQWAMALSFINLATPIFLFGLPGSIVRYVEHFRQKGQLQSFVRWIVSGTTLLTLVAATTMLCQPSRFASLVFRDATIVGPVAALTVALVAIVIFNVMDHLVSALRQVRVATLMQFIHSVAFTMLSIAWLAMGGDLVGLILSFAIAAIIGCAPAAIILARGWSNLPRSAETLTRAALARRIAPYAVSLWLINLIGNLFDISDRYMILHYSSGDAGVGQAMVGEYFSARILPILLLSLGTVVSGVLMPYLTADWESGRRRRVIYQIKKTLLLLSGLFTFGASVGLLIAPWMFQHLLGGRFEQGLQVMPLAFIFCSWASFVIIAQNYLWCAEKGRLVAIGLFFGLATNVCLNGLLLPIMGLYGAGFATTISNLVVLCSLLVFMSRNGFVLDRSVAFAIILPATLMAGPEIAMFAAATVALTSRHAYHFIGQVIAELAAAAIGVRSKMRSRFAGCQ